MNLFKNRKFKYGSAAVGLTCVVVALIVIVNVIFSALSDRYRWYVDMTKEKIYGISDSSIALLDSYKEQSDLHIDIIFCQEEDEIDAEYSLALINNLAKEYKETFDFIDIKYIDVIKEPGKVEQYKSTDVQTIKTTNVIITDGNRSRVYAANAFYRFSSETGNVFAFDGEYKITSAILSMEGDNPIAYFTTGHGETTTGSMLYNLFAEAGYEVRNIDLSKEDLDPAAKVIIVNNPAYDLMGSKATVNEVAKIDKFLGSFGHLMVFLDPTYEMSHFPELSEYLVEWGIKFEDCIIHDYSNSLSVDGTELVAEYAPDGDVGGAMIATISEMADTPKAIVNKARPISFLWTDTDKAPDRHTSVVLSTSSAKSAFAVPFGTPDAAEESAEHGVYNLMTISAESNTVNNDQIYHYVLCAGTSSFTDDTYIGSSSYANRDIIFSAMKALGKTSVPIDIDFKVFENEALDITTAEANRWTVVLAVVLPLIVGIIGTVVYFRRKHL